MKKLLITALIAFSIFGTGATSASKNTKKDIVYIADTGTKFHTSSCRTLKKNKYEGNCEYYDTFRNYLVNTNLWLYNLTFAV